MAVIIFANYFHIISLPLFTSLNKYHNVVTPDVVILCKKYYGTRGARGT